MTIKKLLSPQTREVPNRLAVRPPQTQAHKPGAVQPKMNATTQMRPTPKAPPVYRPQPVPKVLQAKMHVAQQPVNHSSRVPVALPAYRPEQKKVVQPKIAVAAQGQNIPKSPPVYRPDLKPLQPKIGTPLNGKRNNASGTIQPRMNGVVQRMEAQPDDGWEVVGKKKAKATDVEIAAKKLEIAAKKEAKLKEIRTLAEKAIGYYTPERPQSTYCVFLDLNGGLITTGESGWDKSKYTREEIDRHLTTHLVKVKGQKTGYGGKQCAEPNAVVKAARAGSLGNVVYSLAYDQKSRSYKAACGSCVTLLRNNNITDLHS